MVFPDALMMMLFQTIGNCFLPAPRFCWDAMWNVIVITVEREILPTRLNYTLTLGCRLVQTN